MELIPNCRQSKDRAFNSELHNLVRLSQYFNELDRRLKSWLPANLHAHFHVSCIEQQTLVLHADMPAMASRLKMMLPALLPKIQEINPHIRQIQVYLQPRNIAPKAPVSRPSDLQVAQMLEQTAQKVAASPKLSQALQRLAQHLSEPE